MAKDELTSNMFRDLRRRNERRASLARMLEARRPPSADIGRALQVSRRVRVDRAQNSRARVDRAR